MTMQTMTSRKLYDKLNSFMGTMRDGITRKMVEGQQAIIDYLQTKLSIYEEKLAEATGTERPDLTDADRARLAHVAHSLNADQLERNEHTLSPGTFMDWYRELVAGKYTHRTYPVRRGHPAMDQETVYAIIRICRDNSNWGYGCPLARLQGQLHAYQAHSQRARHLLDRLTDAPTATSNCSTSHTKMSSYDFI